MLELTTKQKCLSTIVAVNDGRLDYLTLKQLNDIVHKLLSPEITLYDIIEQVDYIHTIADIVYIADIIAEIFSYETA